MILGPSGEQRGDTEFVAYLPTHLMERRTLVMGIPLAV